MLPTKNKASIIRFGNKLTDDSESWFRITEGHVRIYNHLYILSDEPIKEGDWCHTKRVEGNICIYEKLPSHWYDDCKKIIATTNESLHFKCDKDTCTNYITESCNTLCYNLLPQPSEEFIDKYRTEYNKGNIITDVMVEYRYTIDKSLGHFHQQRKYFLKVNPKDNTITIKKVKNSWDRKEIEALIKKYEKDNLYYGRDAYYNNIDIATEWIKENL